jgi:hypothetical protein
MFHRINKSRSSSVLRRQRLADRLSSSGLPSMIACSGYVGSRSLCIVSRDSTRCVRYIKRGIRCDGTFSTEKFNKVSAQRLKLLKKIKKSRRRSAELLAELTRQSAAEQRLLSQLKSISTQQKSMLRREMQALEKLNALESSEAAVSGVELF